MSYPVNEIMPGVVHYPDTAAVKAKHHGWAYGAFVKGAVSYDPGEGQLELKSYPHQPGAKRDEWAKPEEGLTIDMIIKGETTFWFKDPRDGSVVQVKVAGGEHIVYSNQIPHKWQASEEGAQSIAVRVK